MINSVTKSVFLKSIIKRKGILLFLLFSVTASFFTGCASLNFYRIQYNKEKEIYEYPLPGLEPLVLRNNSKELVTEDNFEKFIAELSHRDFKYPFDERMELASLPKQSDYHLAALYTESIKCIKERDYKKADEALQELERRYPSMLYYSDLAFLKGYLSLQRGQEEVARENFRNFITFSSQKYPERFRNYRYYDQNNTDWKIQKAYARDYLSGQPLLREHEFLREIRPKFYFTSLQPGYTLSEEAIAERKWGILSLSLGTDFMSDFSAGFQYYRNLVKGIDFNPEFSVSGNMWEARAAVPIQLYRSPNNRLGIKVSPFGQYSKIKNYRIAGVKTEVNEPVYNFGVKSSVGFFIIQRLSVGAYYTYNYYNADRPYTGGNKIPDFSWENEYDVSLYIPLIRGLNIKSGIKSGDWVAGFYLPGWELSYNINDREFFLRTDMY